MALRFVKGSKQTYVTAQGAEEPKPHLWFTVVDKMAAKVGKDYQAFGAEVYRRLLRQAQPSKEMALLLRSQVLSEP